MRYQPNTEASGAHILLSPCEASEESRELISAIGKDLKRCLWMQMEENVKRLKVTGENWLQITNPMLPFHHHTHSLSVSQEERERLTRESKWCLTSRFAHHIPLYVESWHSEEKGQSYDDFTVLSNAVLQHRSSKHIHMECVGEKPLPNGKTL